MVLIVDCFRVCWLDRQDVSFAVHANRGAVGFASDMEDEALGPVKLSCSSEPFESDSCASFDGVRTLGFIVGVVDIWRWWDFDGDGESFLENARGGKHVVRLIMHLDVEIPLVVNGFGNGNRAASRKPLGFG